jgi:intracellular multiplication protein IcmJ
VYPLQLNVNPEGWRFFMRRKLDPRFVDFSQKILHRDAFTCQFCGFASRSQQEIINLDHNYFNNKIANLVTACRFCAQCVFLESIGVSGHGGGGVLIYLPEITQNYLNGLCHVLFSQMHKGTEYKETAQDAYRHLKLRAQIIEDEWGESMHEPALFGQLLIESGDKALLAKPVFASVRLLPSRAGFKEEEKNKLNAN